MREDSQYQQKHTFSKRPCFNQIVSYLVILTQQLTFWLTVQPNYHSSAPRIATIVLMLLAILILVIFCLKTSLTDPSDPLVRQFKTGDRQKVFKQLSKCLYCDHCRSYVYATSRHCKLCDRCVHNFDHHCIWINNCVGKQNYKPFMAMLIAAFAHFSIYIASVCALWQQDMWRSYLASMIVNWAVFAVSAVFLVFIAALLAFHFYLVWQGMTTFEFIMAKKTAQTNKNQTKIENSNNQNNANNQNIVNRNSQSQSSNKVVNANPSISQSIQQNMASKQLSSNSQHLKNNMHEYSQESITTNKKKKQSQAEEGSAQMPSSEMLAPLQKQQNDQLGQFYRSHRSLKWLVGRAVSVRPQSQLSSKKRNSTQQQMWGSREIQLPDMQQKTRVVRKSSKAPQ